MLYTIYLETRALAFCPISVERTRDRKRLAELKKMAHDRAVEFIKQADPDEIRGKHILYYYEEPERPYMGRKNGNVEVRVYLTPCVLSDENFYAYVEKWKPDYVGAIHK